MFEQAFKNIDDVLWYNASCTSELDYTEQTSWLHFLKNFDAIDQGECGTFHCNAIKSPQPPVENCVLCHSDVVESSGGSIVIKDASKHINDKLNVSGQERTDW